MKQIFKHFIFILLLIVLNITQLSSRVQAATNPYSQTGPYGTNCTWYAWQMAYEKAGVVLPAWHNAKDWYNDAINSGYTVGTTPQANSIIVWGGWTSYGHVGYVEKVEGNTYMFGILRDLVLKKMIQNTKLVWPTVPTKIPTVRVKKMPKRELVHTPSLPIFME